MSASLTVSGLEIRVGTRVLVAEVSLDLHAGEIVALVGESGSGKTLTSRSLLGMVDLEPGVVAGELVVRVDDHEHRPYAACLGAGRGRRDRAFASLRGSVVGYVPQDCRAALDPLLRVAAAVMAAERLGGTTHGATHWLTRAGLTEPERVARLYPHELSGGMAQRVVIAQALARGSRFLLADEPTTALDPTVQRGILEQLRQLSADGIGVLLVTHDLRILPGLADRVWIMHQGRLVERCTAEALVEGGVVSAAGQALLEATRRVAAGRLG